MAPPANGAEFFYTDLFPATAFLLHPYHAQSLALLTGLWWAVAAAERRLHRFEDQDRQRESGRDAHAHCAPSATRVAPIQPRTGWKRAGRALATLAPAGGPLSAVALLGALLTFSRPYEPLVFALAYGLKTVCAFLVRHRKPAAWRPTCTVLLVLTFALLPGLLWNAFVSLQPVWSSFAHRSLVQDFPRLGWATAFAGLWILGVFGFAPCWRLPHVAGVLPITAATLCPLLLLTTAHAPAKLASGLALGLAMLAGAGAAATIRALHKRLGGWGTVGAGSLLLAGLFGTPSLAMNLLQVQLNQQATLEPAFTRLAQRLPPETGDRPTVVLTDVSSGEILPGLIGVRVYAGHFSLTVNYDAKRAELRRAGLDPENQPTRDGSTRRKLQTVLDRVAPDYALLDARCVHALEELSSQRWEIVAIEDGWHLLRAPAGTTYPLEK